MPPCHFLLIAIESSLKIQKRAECLEELVSLTLTLPRRRPLSYRNQSIDLRSKSMDWFPYDNGLRLERVKYFVLRLFDVILR